MSLQSPEKYIWFAITFRKCLQKFNSNEKNVLENFSFQEHKKTIVSAKFTEKKAISYGGLDNRKCLVLLLYNSRVVFISLSTLQPKKHIYIDENLKVMLQFC